MWAWFKVPVILGAPSLNHYLEIGFSAHKFIMETSVLQFFEKQREKRHGERSLRPYMPPVANAVFSGARDTVTVAEFFRFLIANKAPKSLLRRCYDKIYGEPKSQADWERYDDIVYNITIRKFDLVPIFSILQEVSASLDYTDFYSDNIIRKRFVQNGYTFRKNALAKKKARSFKNPYRK